jgi:hypothetical protein
MDSDAQHTLRNQTLHKRASGLDAVASRPPVRSSPTEGNQMATLTQKVYAFIADEQSDVDHYLYERAPNGDDLREHERDLMGWALIYGIAVAIARTEDPFEPLESVAYRASKAAWTVRKVYAHGFTREKAYPTDEDRQACDWDTPEAEAVTA